jgi:hypothetical protein
MSSARSSTAVPPAHLCGRERRWERIASLRALQTHPPTGVPARRSATPLVALLSLVALACLLARPAPSLARSTARCASRATSRHETCPQRHHRARTHTKRHHKQAAAKHKHAKHAVTVQAPALPAQVLASCEDASRPTLGSEGYACADGSEPVCANEAEPIPTGNGSSLVCPATPGPTVEWSEAACEDGSTPTAMSDGSFACEDGSQPTCEDGSQPVSTEGSLACIAYGAARSSPSPSMPPGQDSEESVRPTFASAS